jgi:DNA repair protein RAD51
MTQGVNGLTARDIKLIIEGGLHTVESVAYTSVTLSNTTRAVR